MLVLRVFLRCNPIKISQPLGPSGNYTDDFTLLAYTSSESYNLEIDGTLCAFQMLILPTPLPCDLCIYAVLVEATHGFVLSIRDSATGRRGVPIDSSSISSIERLMLTNAIIIAGYIPCAMRVNRDDCNVPSIGLAYRKLIGNRSPYWSKVI
jgi:hypothetical protein